MSEFDLNTRKTNFSQNQTRNPSQSLKDQAADASAEMKQRAGSGAARCGCLLAMTS